jgi:hypothetical protein
MKQEHNHLAKEIPNTEENREKVAEFNKLARKSNSMHRLKIKYRKPKKDSPSAKYYGDGSVPKDDAQCFSLYLKKTAKQEKLENEYRRKRYNHTHEYRVKYEKLQSKYNAVMLKPLLQGLVDNVEELQYAVDKGEYWNNIVNSLKGIAEGITEDINNKLEV